MDAEKIQFPHEYLKEAGRRQLPGHPASERVRRAGPRLGGGRHRCGRDRRGQLFPGLPVGSGGGYRLRGGVRSVSEELKQAIVVPLLKGEVYAAECLTEPRGGSDFFGAATIARKDGDDWIISGQKRFIVGAEGADWFLVYAVTDPGAAPQADHLLHGAARRRAWRRNISTASWACGAAAPGGYLRRCAGPRALRPERHQRRLRCVRHG